jgi:hypothetical protein
MFGFSADSDSALLPDLHPVKTMIRMDIKMTLFFINIVLMD